MKVLSLLFAVLFSGTLAAQGFPSKTVRLVSGVTPGSASDTMARILAEKLSVSLGQPVIVENRLGAGGFVGAKYVATAEPDGHTIMMYASAFTVSTLLHPGLDPKDLAPVATVATIPTVLVTAPDKGYKSVADFVARAKANPGKVVCTTAGVGSATHMNLERFRFAAGIEVLNVHMKGAPDALTEVVAGRADCYFALSFQALKMRDAGKVTALAVGSPKRSAMFPDLPTTVELGYAGSDYNFWIGALVSAKTPREIVERLHREINTLVQSAEISGRIRKLGADPLSLTLAEFDAMIASELESNARLIKRAGIAAN
ncbi:MAG TPA: tripartite tricarboxylate transporter substrate-binding protein [Burkholderiales bacterium]|jgi:tripartite-type tricarboxylate transporter receptor subunit TctC|nr:tripartite tricarboxylate transporter substrate-binding protein [Burkholderiales bacterium]